MAAGQVVCRQIEMLLTAETNDQTYKIDLENPIDISIPLDFYGAQPNAFGVERAISKPCEAGSLVGDTRRGGSCNFEQITFIPHCNGTHTECVGHITNQRISVRDCLKDAFIPAVLISVEPENAFETNETYAVKLEENDKIISRKSIEEVFENPEFKIQSSKSGALIVRTLPNDESKKTRSYMENIPPFFSLEAMRLIVEEGFEHLLVDMPSIDRTFDEGKLANHRIFWNIAQRSFETNSESRINSTLTELIYVPNEIEDGFYFLNLQIASFVADAAPSRPLLFKISQ
jgi:arylformamidase